MTLFVSGRPNTLRCSSSSVSAHNAEVISSRICEINIWDKTMPAIWRTEAATLNYRAESSVSRTACAESPWVAAAAHLLQRRVEPGLRHRNTLDHRLLMGLYHIFPLRRFGFFSPALGLVRSGVCTGKQKVCRAARIKATSERRYNCLPATQPSRRPDDGTVERAAR